MKYQTSIDESPKELLVNSGALKRNELMKTFHHNRKYEIILIDKPKRSDEYVCVICGREFALRGIFKQHIERHTKKTKQFHCKKCDKRFLTSTFLEKHKCI